MDGHRKCEVCLTPEEAVKLKGICPVCGKEVGDDLKSEAHFVSLLEPVRALLEEKARRAEEVLTALARAEAEVRSLMRLEEMEAKKETIAKDAYYSYYYALNVLNGPFPLGEPVIARMKQYTNVYTNEVLKKDFYLDGKLICKYEG